MEGVHDILSRAGIFQGVDPVAVTNLIEDLESVRYPRGATIFEEGEPGDRLYIITAFLDHVTNDEFVNWYYYQKDYVRDRTTIYNYIENNKLQDPFYEQVFKPLFLQKAVERKFIISIAPDERAKPDKFARIEGNLEPLNPGRAT